MGVSRTASSLDAFISFSVYLTGFSRFELMGTGMASVYYEWVKQHSGTEFLTLLTEFEKVQLLSDAQKKALIQSGPQALTPLVRSIIKLWYLGQWYNPEDPSKTEILSSQSYQEGLVWDAIKAHPQGAKQQGFGAWASPPEQLRAKLSHEEVQS